MDALAAIASAKAKIAARAQERFEREKAEYDAKLAARTAKAAKTGKKPQGREPKAPDPAPRTEDQVNLTDEESRIMKVAGGGFEQCYNAQAVVDTESMLVMVAQVTNAANDKEQVVPMVGKVQALPVGLNQPQTVLVDSGYFSEKNVATCVAAKIVPLIAVGREGHHPDWRERFTEPEPLAADASPVEKMKQAHPQDKGGTCALCVAQADRGAGVRHHQVGDGVPAVSDAWHGEGPNRMDAGVPGVEFETHGRIASAVAGNGGIRASITKIRQF